MKKKICVITGTRAEYCLLTRLIKNLDESTQHTLQIIATGMHLSPEFGLTYRDIEKDGFCINKKIEILLSSDTHVGTSKSVALATISFAEAYEELSPDLIVVLGDRYEILAAVTAALFAQIPVAHIHGGEVTEGAFDDSIRHCITKMSHLHFAAAEEYKNRIIQMGENPQHVFNVGGLGIDNIVNTELMSASQLEDNLGCKWQKKNFLVTFHPVTLNQYGESTQQLQNLLAALDQQQDCFTILTKCNSDPEGRKLNAIASKYAQDKPLKAKYFDNLGLVRYLSVLKHVDAVIGNSSSGILEAPYFKTATINIGERQKGRILADSVIQCDASEESIRKSICYVFSEDFKKILSSSQNPYGNGGAIKRVMDVLNSCDNLEIKKKFFDIALGVF
ncbi:UDP-N-acetylglucosamine 2-epimerase [Candidatus Uabimicrobium amorphum]|uniref:UDP-N-acetyl glucosamine 2-epimerase n=1 Tax=Uabimicrobium amorphum TaxID=2596890 RepID=A0A5S9ITZ0_UABAM|nr:UDP-N-acetylglucosamine 2-epimerase [Candidatus Uabimicrobium amorphum]BBM87737.1 UDP-N-acetyl glucosamine 2-epimerase [Candidatus Uabimicrobium amorphum]